MVFLDRFQSLGSNKRKDKETEKSQNNAGNENMSERTRNTSNSTSRVTPGKPSKEQKSSSRSSVNSTAAASGPLAAKDKANRPENKPWRTNMRSAPSGEKKSTEKLSESAGVPAQKSRENSSSSLKTKTTQMEIKLESPKISPRSAQNGAAVISNGTSGSSAVKPWENYRYSRSTSSEKSPTTSEPSQEKRPSSNDEKPTSVVLDNSLPAKLASPETEIAPRARVSDALPPAQSPLASPTVETLSLDPPSEPKAEPPAPMIQRSEEESVSEQDSEQNHRSSTENRENEETTPPESEVENGGVRMRQKRAPPPRVVNGATGAIARGLEALAESEMEENLEEIKRLDNQLDHLNDAVGEVEERINKHNDKIREVLDTAKNNRLTRRASFQQRVNQSQQEDQDFHAQVRAMLSKCGQSRRASVPVFSDEVQSLVGQSQAARGEGANGQDEGL